MANEIYDVRLTFTEPLLGTAPLNEEVYTDFVASKAANGSTDDELETLTVDQAIEKGTTGFHRLDGAPILYDYVLKGFFKDACGMLRRDGESRSAKLTAYKKIIDGLLFIEPRRIPIDLVSEVTILERPLRAQTAQGERVALARSEMVSAGSSIAFRVLTVGASVPKTLLDEWFTYGQLRGLGQWRNASYGRFQYELTKR
jgi:hypothetical protein